MTTTSPEVRTSQATLFGVEEVKPKKQRAKKAVQPPKEQNSPLYDEVMRLGKSCNYIGLNVNSSFAIKGGRDGWWAYACLMNANHLPQEEIRKYGLMRIEEIKRAIAKEASR